MSNNRPRHNHQIHSNAHNNNNIKLNLNSGLRKQDNLLHHDYILSKVFRKDGPPLGVAFDNVPSSLNRLGNAEDSETSHHALQEKQRALKRQKTSKPTNIEDQIAPPGSASFKHGMGKGLMTVLRLTNQEGNSVKKHGIGKGLMTIQRLTNLGAQILPTRVDNPNGAFSQFPPSTSQNPSTQRKKKSKKQQTVTRRLVKKVQEKKSSVRSKKVRCEQVDMQKQIHREVCEIALVGGRCKEDQGRYAMLVDDEELELRELQETSNTIKCAHCAVNWLHGCSLCKDLLAKFPPNSVRMKQPCLMQPWDSSPQLVKKLFKILHFVSTYAVIIGIQSFTLDELAQAFVDKDSQLLGKLNIALLKLLLTDVEKELDGGFVSNICKNLKYRGLLQSVERELTVLKLWKKSLNSLTWIEILRQVFVAAGFGSKHDKSPQEPLNKEAAMMASYGLSPGTLKSELFSILSLQGNMGMKISELATYSSIVGLKLATTTNEVEQLISSMLSSDITLFEKISSSAYRLRNSILKNDEDDQSDLEDCGCVDDDPKDISHYHNIVDLEDDSGASNACKHGQRNLSKSKDNTSLVNSEIDESFPGEMWLLGLMEGEYSDLNIEEKLNALLALIDLLRAGSSIRMELL
ncbi:hypothetical protein M8C21_024562 [Ambrosia artemisiifolia]|uniref:DDT domain-containing protein n=1 Tax=Ambrosia artemisiifolia TaxID=4212 RepID=A0AAD5BSY6_AMBAR|nr:hypothetical protein M8C21_024562 [Ambrosia artemisiifolia]